MTTLTVGPAGRLLEGLVLGLMLAVSAGAPAQYSGVMTVGSVVNPQGASVHSQQQTHGGGGAGIVQLGPANYGSVAYGGNANLGGGWSGVVEIQPGVYVIGESGASPAPTGYQTVQPAPPPRYQPQPTKQAGNVTVKRREGRYYQPYGITGGEVAYRLVEPPVGEVFHEIPGDCEQELIGGKRYFRCGHTYLREKISKGDRVYVVVEKP